jgi:flagellar protein FlaG
MLDTIKDVAVGSVEKTPMLSNQYHQVKAEKNQPVNKTPQEQEVKNAVEDLNNALNELNVQRKFSVEKELNQVVVKVLDTSNNEVIRQIPSEEAINLAKNIKEMVGLLFDSKM